MLDPAKKVELEKGLKILNIVWIAIFAMLIIYVAISHSYGGLLKDSIDADLLKKLKLLFPGLAGIGVFLSIFLRKSVLSEKKLMKITEPKEGRNVVHLPSLINKYTVIVIIASAISESVGIFGMVLYLLGDTLRTLYSYIALSGIALFYHKPRIEDLEQIITSLETPLEK